MNDKGTGGLGGRLRVEFERLKGADPFQVLGVAPSADGPAVRWAFLELTKRYHPNRFARDPADQRELANEVFLLIRRAYELLSDEARRRTWRERVTSGRTGPATQTPPITVPPPPKEGRRGETSRPIPIPQSAPRMDLPPVVATSRRPSAPLPAVQPPLAEAVPPPVGPSSSEKRRLFEEANRLMEQGKYAEARQVYDRVGRAATTGGARPPAGSEAKVPPRPTSEPAAVSFRPPAPAPSGTPSQGVPKRPSDVGAVLEQARSRTQRFDEALRLFTQGHYREAREAFHRLATEDSQQKRYRVYLSYAMGLEHREAGRIDDAVKELERAVFLDPDLAEARRDLDKTRELKKTGGGLFSKLFGR